MEDGKGSDLIETRGELSQRLKNGLFTLLLLLPCDQINLLLSQVQTHLGILRLLQHLLALVDGQHAFLFAFLGRTVLVRFLVEMIESETRLDNRKELMIRLNLSEFRYDHPEVVVDGLVEGIRSAHGRSVRYVFYGFDELPYIERGSQSLEITREYPLHSHYGDNKHPHMDAEEEKKKELGVDPDPLDLQCSAR